MMRTPYEILGCDRQLSTAEIRRAYLRLARIYHPDYYAAATPEKQLAAEFKMQVVNGAWYTLRDPDRRRHYDLFGPKHIGSVPPPEAETEAPGSDAPKSSEISETQRVAPQLVRVPVGLLVAGIVMLGAGFMFEQRPLLMGALVIVFAAGLAFITASMFAMPKARRDRNYH